MPPTTSGGLNPAQRAAGLRTAVSTEQDVVVIGGGVTGAGCALDAVTRGLRVVLVEAGDLALGTSSRSGKIFHGGLRYLEQYNFSLVAHAIAERDLQVRTLCPHLTQPEPFLYPLTRHWERPYAGAGITLYDVFGLKGRAVPKQRHFTRRGLVKHVPSIDPRVVTGGIQYYDVRMDDARHTMTVARSAAALGAHIITRAPVVDFLRAGPRITGVIVADELTGERHEIRAKVVVNAAGAWSSDLQQKAGVHSFDVQPSKGVHLLLRKSAIDSDTGILARASDSVIIARRWWDYWLVGTTDTPWDWERGTPVPEKQDIDYLLTELNRFLSRKVGPQDILGVYAGVRPLLKPVGDDSDATSALSRDHSIMPGPDGLVTIVGGKYTTYRLMAQDTLDGIVKSGVLGRHVPASLTRTTALIGAYGWAALRNRVPNLAADLNLTEPDVRRLLSRYGSLIRDVIAVGSADPSLTEPRPDWAGYLPAELLYAVTAEGALSLSDVMTRRTHLAIELPDGGRAAADDIARLIRPTLGWSEQETENQVASYLAEVDADRAALDAIRGQVPTPAQTGSPLTGGTR